MKRYFLATRPWSFPVSVVSILVTTVGLFYLGFPINWWLMAWAILGIILFHAAGNTLSDYFDFRRSVDTPAISGSRTLVDGIMTPQEMLRYALILLAVACVCGVGLMLATGWQLLIFGVLGALLASFYYVLKFHALGDLDIFLCFGLLPALGTSFVVTGDVRWEALWFVLAFSPITNGVLHANNTRDILTDKAAHIHTLPMLIGLPISRLLYYSNVLLPILWVITCVILDKMPWAALAILLSLPLAIRNCKMMARFTGDNDAINHLDECTAQQQLISSGLLFLSTLIYTLIVA